MAKSIPPAVLHRRPDHRSETTDDLGRHFHLISCDLKNTRELRTLLLDAAYELEAQPDLTDAHIYLHSCTLAKKRVQMEVEQFKRIARRQIAKRIELHDMRTLPQSQDVRTVDSPAYIDSPLRAPNSTSQEAVIAYLLQRHLAFLPGVNIATIAAETKASLPTIYKVLSAHEHCIEKDPEDKTVGLRHFDQSDWLRWIQRTNRLSSVYYIDRSGSPRSAKRLAKALAGLRRDDLAIGGLAGALHHLPALDATSAPQLDILIHGTRRSDLSFITELDPGLELFEGRADMANVVVHFVDRPASLFVMRDGQNCGSLPDCIANMYKAGLTHQVDDALRLLAL